jgi:hypothetical protein
VVLGSTVSEYEHTRNGFIRYSLQRFLNNCIATGTGAKWPYPTELAVVSILLEHEHLWNIQMKSDTTTGNQL